MRVVFFGTPAFALPTLRRLATDSRFTVALVVSQPDRPAGRGRRVESSPVTRAARELDLPVYQPASLRTAEARQPLANAAADLFVVVAYGVVFGPSMLALPRLGCVNVHASLLPRYRGASPIPAAILAGDGVSGVTLMRMEAGLDTGPIIASADTPLTNDDTSVSLGERLSWVGAELAIETLPRFAAGLVVPMPQPAAGASLTRPLTKADGWLDWTRVAEELERQVRAMWPWPRAWTTVDGDNLQVHTAAVVPNRSAERPGRRIGVGSELIVACGRDALWLTTVQPAGGRPMSDAAFRAGRRGEVSHFGRRGEPAAVPPLVVEV